MINSTIGYIISEKNKYYFREYDRTLFISDLFQVCLIQVDDNTMLEEDIINVIRKSVLFQVLPENLPVFIFEDFIIKKIKSSEEIIFQKILYKNSVFWINQDNLLIINEKIYPSKIKSLNNHASRK